MEFGATEEANDLLSNGILVETSKGLVCMSLNDALSSNLNLSVEDLQNVATQLLLQQNKTETVDNSVVTIQKVASKVTCDIIGDSDGFTSESSDISGAIHNSEALFAVQLPENSLALTNYINSTTKSKFTENLVVLSTDPENFSSTVSDSDTNSVTIKLEQHKRSPALKKENETEISQESEKFNDTHKIPVKKRGGWPKGRKRKPELLHLPPKAPATGYNLYLNDQRMLLKDSNLPFHEKTKLIGNKWSSLSLEEKRPYLEKAEEEKRRYREEFKQYRQSGAYQLYLANKRRKRAKYNVLSESDMDATDDIDDEDNEELYCRTCDQWFHNLHNKREHLLGRQHQQSIAGAITKELNSDYETDATGTGLRSCLSFSTSLDESSLDAMPSTSGINQKSNQNSSHSVLENMSNLLMAVKQRENEIKSLQQRLQETKDQHGALYKQLCSLTEVESKLNKESALLKEQERDMELKVFQLWQVPSWFIITNLNETTEEYIMD